MRIKLVLEDMDGIETSHVFEYVYQPYKQVSPRSELFELGEETGIKGGLIGLNNEPRPP